MSNEQAGPPTDEDRERRDIEWVRTSQLRFCEGYHARMAEPHPMKRDRNGKELNTREPKWSFADAAEDRCPGRTPKHLVSTGVVRFGKVETNPWPAHERERWIAGFHHADAIASTQGEHAMNAADPSRPPKRPKKMVVATQEDLLGDDAPRIPRREVKEWWREHHGFAKAVHGDAGEQ